MSTRSFIEINHDYLHEFRMEGIADFIVSLKGTTPRPPYGITVLGQRHHSDPEFKVPDETRLERIPMPNVREWFRAAPDSVVIRFAGNITNEQIEAFPKALVAACASHERLPCSDGGPTCEVCLAASPYVNGVGRLATWDAPDAAQAERVIEVYFNRRPSDDELRAFHDFIRGFPQSDPPVPARGDDTRVATGVKSALVNEGSTPSGSAPTLAELEAILQPGNPRPVGRCATTQTERYRVEGCTCKTYEGNEGLPCLTWCQGGAADACVYCDHNLDCHRRLSAMFKNDAPAERVQDAPLSALTLAEGFGDPETLFNSRNWMRKAIEAKGAKVTGGGVGMGQADLDFTLEGCSFNISLRPIVKNPNPSGHVPAEASGHTPGSFVVDAERPTYPQADRPLGYYVAHAESGGRVAQVFENCLVTTEEEALANAQLFAAAPRLLAHLRFAVKILGGMPGIGGTAQVDAMRAAIDAARVEPSKIARQFCEFCGAGVGLFRRDGEGTCHRCDPVAQPKGREHG